MIPTLNQFYAYFARQRGYKSLNSMIAAVHGSEWLQFKRELKALYYSQYPKKGYKNANNVQKST